MDFAGNQRVHIEGCDTNNRVSFMANGHGLFSDSRMDVGQWTYPTAAIRVTGDRTVKWRSLASAGNKLDCPAASE